MGDAAFKHLAHLEFNHRPLGDNHTDFRFVGIAAHAGLTHLDLKDAEIAQLNVAALNQSILDSIKSPLNNIDDLLLGQAGILVYLENDFALGEVRHSFLIEYNLYLKCFAFQANVELADLQGAIFAKSVNINLKTQLQAARAKVAELENMAAIERNRELGALPAKFGFVDVNELIAALKSLPIAPVSAPSPAPAAAAAVAPVSAPPAKKKRYRAVITPDTATSVKRLVEAGKTGIEVAKELKISIPTVQKIKKSLGLVKGPKAPAAKKPAPKRVKKKAKK